MNKIAYIAGPYRAKTRIGRVINIIKARRVAAKYWRLGYIAICPHSNSAWFDKHLPDKEWLDRYLLLLELCDVVVLMKGWKESSGTKAEYRQALRLGKDMIYE